ncbi:MAG: hypothetical protein MI749_18210, partial [Desulfovibrionales bacterium]|nr:hypothetical protein [Desulfovibrionales bacterium]
PSVSVGDLPDYITRKDSLDSRVPSVFSVFENNIGFAQAVEEYQKALISHALSETGWVKAKAAELLQMNRTTLVEKIKKMNLQPEPEVPIF